MFEFENFLFDSLNKEILCNFGQNKAFKKQGRKEIIIAIKYDIDCISS
jgi:hypothetical protein